MDDICRLCCSKNFVNNSIFDEENALYLKMSLYLPIKVFKNDRLPQKVCDKCSCKVNDFYQFCNETIEVQNRLRTFLLSSGVSSDEIVDLTRVKDNSSPLPVRNVREQSTQTDCDESIPSEVPNQNVEVKQEPRTLSPIKEESPYDDNMDIDQVSDNSDDVSLITLKKKKKSKKSELNGVEKKPRKRKPKPNNLESIMNALPDGTDLSVVKSMSLKTSVKEEFPLVDLPVKIKDFNVTLDVKQVKNELSEMEVFHCCICMMQCFSKNEMMQHYRAHGSETTLPTEPPPAPPPPPAATPSDPLRCLRCRKSLMAEEWGAHWRRHWERDRRPYKCALCERTYRDPHQILKHGLTHDYAEGAAAAEPDKRFVCDLCPEGFVYMRYLQAHRTRAHPEAAARALTLRCGVCARAFAHLNSLRRHLRAHSGERNYLCNVCGKALSSREHLKFHIRIHTGYKPNVCKTCGKGFVKKCNLTLHERVHSGEKPHVCSHCGKAFSQRSTLVIHERYHSGSRPYVCGLCGRGFVAKGLLSMHLKSTCI